MLESIAAVAPGVIVLAVAAYYVLETWRRPGGRPPLPSLLVRALYRVGARPGRLAEPEARREIAIAERSCTACAAIGACREWLESGSRGAYRGFCPNAALVERLGR